MFNVRSTSVQADAAFFPDDEDISNEEIRKMAQERRPDAVGEVLSGYY